MARLARGLWPDGNPLRRAADRAEAVLVGALAALFLIGSPVAAVVAWHWAAAAGRHAERIELAHRYKVPAVLLQRVPAPAYTPYGVVITPVRARWTAPDGARLTGLVNAATGAPGTRVTVWTDRSGNLVSAPLLESQVVHQAAYAATSAAVVLWAVLLVSWVVASSVLNSRKMAAWDADWKVTGPLWTSRR